LCAGEDAGALAHAYPHAQLWLREAGRGARASAWPPDGPYDAATLRMPRAREAYVMALHALAAKMREGAALYVYGANDEGIRSAPKALAPYFSAAVTVLAKGRARVWRAQRTAAREGLRGALAAWRSVTRLVIGGRAYEWVSYPGVFAHGRVDPGTALLLAHLPEIAPDTRALDFGAGSGVIARALVDRGAQVDMLEADAVALAAARENVPEARAVLGAHLADLGETRYALIASNPPLHTGRRRDLSVITHLVAEAPSHLAPSGALLLVTERTVPLARHAGERFATVTLVAEKGGHRVWQLANSLPKPRGTS
jgi:16S rRNA (guanine1207-N2)-methyltransferase